MKRSEQNGKNSEMQKRETCSGGQSVGKGSPVKEHAAGLPVSREPVTEGSGKVPSGCFLADAGEHDPVGLPQAIVSPLLRWYAENARPLPWRMMPDPYRVWVSEIMLQQTRVEAVKPYYERFLSAFPDIRSFAAAGEDVYLKYWEGLGYYSRVRNMHRFAVEVTEKYGGVIPGDRETLLRLPGIGPYTSGAIASIAYGVPVPAVDGNVLRVVTRLTSDGGDIGDNRVRRRIEEAIAAVIPAHLPGDFNQALIELGATVCVPNGEAQCSRCPVREFCQAFAEGTVEKYPVKAPKAARRAENKTVLLVTDGKRILLDKRPARGLLAGLYEFPNREGLLTRKEAEGAVLTLGLEPLESAGLPAAKHIFTHIEWHMVGYLIRVAPPMELPAPYLAADLSEVRDNYALPSAFAAYRACLPEI